MPIVDPAAVEAAFAAGVGTEIETTVGGQLDPQRFMPLPIKATVKMLSDGRFRSESFSQEWYSGNTAVLQMGKFTLVVSSRPVHLFDRSLFYAHGQDPRDFDLVIVKSPHCQHHMYAEWCTRLINVDAAGSTSANLPTLGHKVCRRPIFPLDGSPAWTRPPSSFRVASQPERKQLRLSRLAHRRGEQIHDLLDFPRVIKDAASSFKGVLSCSR